MDRMRTPAYLRDLSFAVGSQCFDVAKAVNLGKTISTEEILLEAGFAQHYRCPPEQTSYDLALESVRKMTTSPSKIGAILYTSCIPSNQNAGSVESFEKTKDVKYLMDYPGSRLQSALGMDDAFVVGLAQQACTGLLGTLRFAKLLLESEPELENVLCLTSDRFPEGALYEQAYNLISDGAASCVVSTEPVGFKILSCHQLTNGAMGAASDDETVGHYFSYSHRVITQAVAKAGLKMSDIRWIVPQNTNCKAWQILSRLLGVSYEQVYFPTLSEVGHMISGDNIVNLSKLQKDTRLKKGERILMPMAGYGLNWQCVVIEAV
jgi:3-oxoacyl-[acyl-carrier-protein] synthase-3